MPSIPAEPANSPVTRRSGPIVHCFGVIDEADIVEHFLEHHLSIGVDAFVAADVGSTDGTLEILGRYERAGYLRLIRIEDADADWTLRMITAAREDFAAEWCLFGDPDEFWMIAGGDLRSYLDAVGTGIVLLPRYNMVPSRNASGAIAHFSEFELRVSKPVNFYYHQPHNFFEDFPLRRAERDFATMLLGSHPPEILRVIGPKVVARPELITSVIPGFHDVISIPPEAPRHHETVSYIAHYPIRSAEQLLRKAALVARHYDQIERDPEDSWHWARLSVLFRHGLVKQEFERQVLDDDEVALRLFERALRRDPTPSRALAKAVGRGKLARPAGALFS